MQDPQLRSVSGSYVSNFSLTCFNNRNENKYKSNSDWTIILYMIFVPLFLYYLEKFLKK